MDASGTVGLQPAGLPDAPGERRDAPAGEEREPANGDAARDDAAHPLRGDLRKYYRIAFGTEAPSLRQRIRLLATHLGLHCVLVYRYDRWARRARARTAWAIPLVKLAALLSSLCEFVHHVRVHADVGPGFYIGHVGTIYIGPTTIGRNFSCTHNVTVGLGHSEVAKGYPTLGDDVWVGTGAVIAGAIRIGHGATIAHGAMITRSIPDRAFAAGNPGRVVLQNYDNSALLGQPAELVAAIPRAAGADAAGAAAAGTALRTGPK